MIYINKILPIIVSPLGLIIVLLFFGILRKKVLHSLVALTVLIILSLPIVSNHLIKLLEQNYTYSTPNEIASADTVIVLSGMVKPIKRNNDIHYEFSEAVDRIFAGINLLKEGKAQEITPARISQKLASEIQKITTDIYKKINLSGICRIDFIIKNGKPFVIEINTIPGLSEKSIIPKQLKVAGYNLKEVFSICLEN